MTPDRTPAQLQEDMEATRISYERWRQIRFPSRPGATLREEYPDEYEGLKRDAERDRAEEEGGDW